MLLIMATLLGYLHPLQATLKNTATRLSHKLYFPKNGHVSLYFYTLYLFHALIIESILALGFPKKNHKDFFLHFLIIFRSFSVFLVLSFSSEPLSCLLLTLVPIINWLSDSLV